MQQLFENWQRFLKEEELNEVSEEELEDISGVLHDLKPEDLSFGNIFGDKMRLIAPMRTKDKNLIKLKKTLKKSGYTPDFSTGLATYYVANIPGGFDTEGNPKKPSTLILTTDQRDLVNKREDETQEKYEERIKLIQKKQIKIGKLLQKGSRLFDSAKKSQNEFEKMGPTTYGPDEYAKYRRHSMELEDEAEKDYNKLRNVFGAELPVTGEDENKFQSMASWWNKKGTFYRENPEAAESGTATGEYSIIYSRHPIDVFRMADFDGIESCHSPRTRGGSGEYYKCAVAEAHGHGPVAYVIKNSDLQDVKKVEGYEGLSDQDLLNALQENDEELFMDRERNTGVIDPISRVRLKKYTNPALEMSLAVPEQRTYGKKFPNLVKNIIDWAKENQKDAIEKIEKAVEEDDALDLSKFERHGGTYQDTDDSSLFYAMLGHKTTGRARIDSTTEDNLELNSNIIGQWQQEVDGIRDNFRMRAIEVTATVEDDGAGEAYIDMRATFYLKIDEDDFVVSAFQDNARKAIESIPQELIDYGYHFLQDYSNYTVRERQVVIEIPVDIEQVNPEGGGYAYSPDNFQEILEKIDEADDNADAIEEIARGVLKREGILEGAALMQLARALEDESWYEWSHEVDDDWNPTQIEIETATYVNFEDLKDKIPITFNYQPDKSSEVYIEFASNPIALASKTHGGEDFSFKGFEVRSPEFEIEMMGGFMSLDAVKEYVQWEVTKMILRPKGSKTPRGLESSRDYHIAVKELMRQAAEGEEGEFSYPRSSMWVNGPDSDDEYRMTFGLSLYDGDSDEVVNNAHKIITETDDEDQLKEIFRNAFIKVAKIPIATMAEVKNHFNKFKDVIF